MEVIVVVYTFTLMAVAVKADEEIVHIGPIVMVTVGMGAPYGATSTKRYGLSLAGKFTS